MGSGPRLPHLRRADERRYVHTPSFWGNPIHPDDACEGVIMQPPDEDDWKLVITAVVVFGLMGLLMFLMTHIWSWT